jgi:hypothetical protein
VEIPLHVALSLSARICADISNPSDLKKPLMSASAVMALLNVHARFQE